MERALQAEPPLVGRGVELERIVAGLDAGAPAAFVLAGAAGIGKTRLASEVVQAAAARGFAIAEVAASRSAGAIPFGPFAPLLPVGDPASDLLGLLRQGSAAILERAGLDGRLLLVVDDAHLLDDGSAALVHQLVRTRACSVLAIVRTPEPAPEPVTALWKDGLAERIELDALDEPEVAQVVAAALGGPVAGASVRRLWEVSGGNALYLRELLVGAADSGALTQTSGIWSLRLPLTAPARLVELIAARLQGMAPATVAAIELVAAGEPLSLSLLERLSDPAAIEDAERGGFVQLNRDGRRTTVRLAHPLYGETLRQSLPAYRLGRISAALAGALEQTGVQRREDLLRLARWHLDAGVPDSDGALLARAARRAIEMFDMELAERLAARALDCGGGVDAGLVLGEAKFRSGHALEAEAVLAALAERCANDLDVARVASARAHNLHMQLDDAAGAAAVLDAALATIRDEAARARLLGRQATNRVMEGRPEEALAAAAPLLDAADDVSLTRGTYISSIALALLGRGDEAVAVAERGLEAHRRLSEANQLPEAQLIGAVLGHTAAGRLHAAEVTASAGYAATLAAAEREGQATFCLLRGCVFVEQGRLEAAGRDFLEGRAINRDLNDLSGHRWCVAGLALSEGMRGNVEGARAAIGELDGLASTVRTLFDHDVIERGRAWAAVAAGELTRARELLVRAAGEAAAARQLVAEMRLLHDLARLGAPAEAGARLELLAATVGGGFAAAAALHAGALVRRSASEVEAAGAAFAALGAALLAAEADLSAARLFRTQGLPRRATALSRRAEALLAECGEARTPGLLLGEEASSLTRRELEIAGLAATGASSRDIAAALVLSVRTVDNHLQNVYGKLGVSGRAELAAALRGVDAPAVAQKFE